MKFSVTQTDTQGNPLETVELDIDMSNEELQRELMIYCTCGYLDENPDDTAVYTEGAVIEGVGPVNHHGWLCPKCGKYVQVG